MSTDFKVYTSQKPETASILTFLENRKGEFTVEGEFQDDQGNILVSRKIRNKDTPIFTIDGPFTIDNEDMEDMVTPFLLSPEWLIEINIPTGYSESDYKTAIALCKLVAKENQGALYDPQQDSVLWPNKRPKMYKAEKTSEKISIVSLKWYLPYSRRGTQTAKLLVQSMSKHLRESLPRRFGVYEPFQGKVENDNYEDFYALWNESLNKQFGESLHFSSTSPCCGGAISFPRHKNIKPHPRTRSSAGKRIMTITMDFDSRALKDKAWCDACKNLFVSFARTSGSFYAIGYVERGYEIKANKLWSNGPERYPLPRTTNWIGIPPIPAWLTWFGSIYANATLNSCKAHITEKYEDGILIEKRDKPETIDMLLNDAPPYPKQLCAKLSKQTVSRKFFGKYRPPTPFNLLIKDLSSFFGIDKYLEYQFETDKPAANILDIESLPNSYD